MTRIEFKTALFSYCEKLCFVVYKDTVELKGFGTIFYIPECDDDKNTISYTPIPIIGNATILRKVITNYDEETLEIYKHIAKQWRKFDIKSKIKQKINNINSIFK